MKAETSRASTGRPRKISDDDLHDTVGQIALEVGIVESLAEAAVEIAGRKGDAETCRRRLGDLAVLISNAAREAYETAHDFDKRVRER